jgi:hypothetical protein
MIFTEFGKMKKNALNERKDNQFFNDHGNLKFKVLNIEEVTPVRSESLI